MLHDPKQEFLRSPPRRPLSGMHLQDRPAFVWPPLAGQGLREGRVRDLLWDADT